jgi:hypothetical protein
VIVMAGRERVVVRMRPRSARRRLSLADVAEQIGVLLEEAPDGRVASTLRELALATGADVQTVRSVLASLEPADHVVSVDVRHASPAEDLSIEWAPVTAVIDLLLDWDLFTLDISAAELTDWLGASPAVTRRTLTWLARCPGVSVRRPALEAGTVRIALDVDRCPLTAEGSLAAG